MNRLKGKMVQAKKQGEKLFCAFLTAGFPNLRITERLICDFDREGVDMIELGFPFSDPLADGPTIQFSSQWALDHGVRLRDMFQLARRVRKKGCGIPLIFFGYANPLLQYGWERFIHDAVQAGFDGLIVPDLPPEEAATLRRECRQQGLMPIFLIAPTTNPQRIRRIDRASAGFVYYVSVRGVTGARKALPSDLKEHLRSVQKSVKLPLLIGFGISTPQQAQILTGMSDGVIVGSALIDRLRRYRGKVTPVKRWVRQMVRAVKRDACLARS